MSVRPKVNPFLWFDGRAEEAATFYVSVFPNSRLLSVEKLSGGPAEGSAVVEFEIDGLRFGGVDGGPMYRFTPAVSFSIACESQEEIDYYWDRLSDGGAPGQCGWLEDRFGLSWQVVPTELPALMEKAAAKVMEAMLPMGKLDLKALRRAAQDA